MGHEHGPEKKQTGHGMRTNIRKGLAAAFSKEEKVVLISSGAALWCNVEEIVLQTWEEGEILKKRCNHCLQVGFKHSVPLGLKPTTPLSHARAIGLNK